MEINHLCAFVLKNLRKLIFTVKFFYMFDILDVIRYLML